MNREFIENQIKVVLTHIRGYSISFIMMKGKLKNEMSFSTYYVGKYIVLKKVYNTHVANERRVKLYNLCGR